jgi:hypothetical protein
MISKKSVAIVLIGCVVGLSPSLTQSASAQTTATQEQQQKQKALEEKALQLVEQIFAEVHSLKLPENRIRVQFTAADLIWPRDEARARALFSQAAAGITEMMRSVDTNDRQYFNQIQAPNQLRQQLLSTVARRDASLAYDILLSTRQPQGPQTGRGANRQNSEYNLEMSLMAQIAANDPVMAMKKAEEALDKGQFPRSLVDVMGSVQRKDKELGAKLADKITRRLRLENLLSNQEAASFAIVMLRMGPRPAGTEVIDGPVVGQLEELAYRELLDAVVTAAMNATVRAPQPGQGNAGRRNQPQRGRQNTAPGSPEAAQNNGRSLLLGLQSLLPAIDKYAPARATALRQKISEAGGRTDVRRPGEFADLARGSVDSILEAAPNAPPEVQDRLYQQAAMRAAREGDPDRARQIAAEHLDPTERTQVNQEVDRQEALRAAMAGDVEKSRQALAGLRTDAERVNWLTQMATAAAGRKDQKLALELMQEARGLTGRRAESYQQLEAQLQVARAYIAIDPAPAVEVLEQGIYQLNELMSAAQTLSGFEVRIFKEGELPIQGGGGGLGGMIGRYAQEIGNLARNDFDLAQTAASRFQRPEARIMTQLSMARGVLQGPISFARLPRGGLSDPGIRPQFRSDR